MRHDFALAVAAPLSLVATTSFAGPPFTTDDPEPVEFRHWEFYLATQQIRDRGGWSGTAPHIEVNYGVVPDLQLHVVAPLAYSAPNSGTAHYSYGDMELGIKFRFIHERPYAPMIGTFPFLEVPTAAFGTGLGNGTAQLFVPVWLQKGFGPWQTYGGAGVWIDLGVRNRHWWYFGWQVQRSLFKLLTIGAEVSYQTPKGYGGERDLRFNVGGVIDLGTTHHILLSGGRGLVGPNLLQAYAAWLVTFGPAEDASR